MICRLGMASPGTEMTTGEALCYVAEGGRGVLGRRGDMACSRATREGHCGCCTGKVVRDAHHSWVSIWGRHWGSEGSEGTKCRKGQKLLQAQ